MNNLEVTLFLNELELICLHTVKWFQALLSKTDRSVASIMWVVTNFALRMKETKEFRQPKKITGIQKSWKLILTMAFIFIHVSWRRFLICNYFGVGSKLSVKVFFSILVLVGKEMEITCLKTFFRFFFCRAVFFMLLYTLGYICRISYFLLIMFFSSLLTLFSSFYIYFFHLKSPANWLNKFIMEYTYWFSWFSMIFCSA